MTSNLSESRQVAIVGGGMAGLAAAWRLSRPDGPRPEITVYQRDGLLGGKGASTRGPDGRIQEHGFHVWLGYYDNAFRLLREVYAELDRSPACPIRTVEDAFTPASTIGIRDGEDDWVATFPTNDLVPGEGDGSETLRARDFVRHAAKLVAAFTASLQPARSPAVLSARRRPPRRVPSLDRVSVRRAATLVELIAVMLRGIAADELNTRGYASIDDLDFREWLAKHGASPGVLDGPLVRGVYDLVFGYAGGDRARPLFAAGAGVHLSARMFLTYRGAIFWRMTAGMGDVVFAPLYEALLRRGVCFRFFHRLEDMHVSDHRVEALTFAASRGDHEPLETIGGLPVFRDAPTPPLTPTRIDDFDDVVLAVSLGAIPMSCRAIVAAQPKWRSMVDNVGTVATQSVQLWIDESEAALGARHPGAVLTCCGAPFDTVASMSHSLVNETWSRAPLTSMSLCAVLADGCDENDVVAARQLFLTTEARRLWPRLREVRASYVRANTDPSDRYVQSLPGTGRYRLRADNSGYDNLWLAGDWLDTGLNAGCIEAATLGGLQAANALEGRPLTDATVGFRPHSHD